MDMLAKMMAAQAAVTPEQKKAREKAREAEARASTEKAWGGPVPDFNTPATSPPAGREEYREEYSRQTLAETKELHELGICPKCGTFCDGDCEY